MKNLLNFLIENIFLKCFLVENAIMPNTNSLKVWNILLLIIILSNLFVYPIDMILGINNMRTMYNE